MDKPSAPPKHRRLARLAAVSALTVVACGGPAVDTVEPQEPGIATPRLACAPAEELGSAPAPGDPVTLVVNNRVRAARELWLVAADGSTSLLGPVAAGKALRVRVQVNAVVLVQSGERCVVATRAAAGINHFDVDS
jgi:hypothetical protein